MVKEAIKQMIMDRWSESVADPIVENWTIIYGDYKKPAVKITLYRHCLNIHLHTGHISFLDKYTKRWSYCGFVRYSDPDILVKLEEHMGPPC